MSSRARVIGRNPAVPPFGWSESVPFVFESELLETGEAHPARQPVPEAPPVEAAEDRTRVATLEREAFATAYAQGEKSGLEAGTKRADAMLRRLSDSVHELEELRRTMIRQTEHQIVQLAIEMARRIVRREVQTDNDLLCAMARVALDRLGDTTPATIRLNPEDYHPIIPRQGGTRAGTTQSR